MEIRCQVIQETYGEWDNYTIKIDDEELDRLAGFVLRKLLDKPFKENDNEAERNSG